MKKILILILILVASFALHAERSKEERKALFRKATQELKDSGIEKKIPNVGDKFPDLTLGGKKISQWVKEGPLVVTFYRGGWCPYCVKQLKELNTALSDLKNSKVNLIAIAPEKESEVRKTKSKNNLDFTLISDKDNSIARQLNLVFTVDSEVAKEYKNLGIDLKNSQGNNKNELPVPGTFVIGQENKIAYAFADADYTKRADLSQIINAVKGIK